MQTSQKILNYSYDTLHLLENTLVKENVEYAHMSVDDVWCYDNAASVSDHINAQNVKWETFCREALLAIDEALVDTTWDLSLIFFGLFIYNIALSVGVLVAEIVCSDSINAYHSDLIAAFCATWNTMHTVYRLIWKNVWPRKTLKAMRPLEGLWMHKRFIIAL